MLPYYPALRAKPGEFAACGNLASRYQGYVCPRFVVPPPTEYDPEKGRVPTLDEIAHITGERLGKNWPLRRAFLDPQLAASALGDEGIEKLFRHATAVNPQILPVLTIADLLKPARKRLLQRGTVKAGIYADFEGADPAVLQDGLRQIGLRAEECVLFVDFTGAPLGEDFAPAIAEIFDQLDSTARWAKIVYQASAYPNKLPVGPNEHTLIQRAEWTTFIAALKETSVQPDRLAYGDFGADCGRMIFPKKGGGRPRPHLRYTGTTHTLVVRGSDSGAFTPTMREVCKQIIENEKYYCGRGFSYADERIYRMAKGVTETCGDSSFWRELNTAHHIVRVVRDLGAMSGVAFQEDVVGEFAEQGSLF